MFGHAQMQKLLRIVPLVEGTGRIESFIALQPDQLRAQNVGKHFGAFGLADSGRPFDQERLAQSEHQFEGRRKVVVGNVTARGECLA